MLYSYRMGGNIVSLQTAFDGDLQFLFLAGHFPHPPFPRGDGKVFLCFSVCMGGVLSMFSPDHVFNSFPLRLPASWSTHFSFRPLLLGLAPVSWLHLGSSPLPLRPLSDLWAFSPHLPLPRLRDPTWFLAHAYFNFLPLELGQLILTFCLSWIQNVPILGVSTSPQSPRLPSCQFTSYWRLLCPKVESVSRKHMPKPPVCP